MHLPRRVLLAAAPALVLGGCFGKPGMTQAAQDAQLIVAAVTPVARGAGSAGATPATVAAINEALATATAEASVLATQYTPGYIDTQEFYVAARDLLRALATVDGLPPAALGVIDAATALLPTFAAVVGATLAAPAPKMSAEQARLVLRGTETAVVAAPATPAPPAPPPAAVRSPPPASVPSVPGTRFHVSADDFGGKVRYEFWDSGKVIERGVVAGFGQLEARFAAFKKLREEQAP